MSLTLLTVSNINHRLVEFAMAKTLQAVPVDRVVVLSDQHLNLPRDHSLYRITPEFGMLDYCDFCIKGMSAVVDTDHVLIAQYDGMAVNADRWTSDYLDYDYVGSLSHVDFYPVQQTLKASGYYAQFAKHPWFTCGGGLSLRSKKLLHALAQDPDIVTVNQLGPGQDPLVSEDLVITLLNRTRLEQRWGIRFAPLELGLQFCAEVLTHYTQAMGFHGWYNAPWYLTEDECLFYFQHLTKSNLVRHTVEMQMCKYATMMQSYTRLRQWFVDQNLWIVY
jgi:hypothetical protein